LLDRAERKPGRDTEAAVGGWTGDELAAVDRCSLPHADETVPTAGRRRGRCRRCPVRSAGAGLGALLANQTAAVTVSLVWLLAVEGLVVSITSTPTLHDWLPGGALGVIARGAGEGAHTPLWAAAGCAVAYTGALVAAGTRRLIDRDVT
jgi:hypothetical protein